MAETMVPVRYRNVVYIWLSQNPNVKYDMARRHYADKPWSYDRLIQHPSTPITAIIDSKYTEYALTDTTYDQALNSHASAQDIIDYPNEPWCWDRISYSDRIRFSFVLDNVDKPWNWRALTHNLTIATSDMLAHPDMPWEWEAICRLRHITMQDILNHPRVPWKWDVLAANSGITLRDMLTHGNYPWNISHYVGNENITYHDFKTLAGKLGDAIKGSMNWRRLAMNSMLTFSELLEIHKDMYPTESPLYCYATSLTMQDIVNHPQEPWEWKWVCRHVVLRDVEALHLPKFATVDWYSLSMNPSLDIQHIMNAPRQPWTWENILKHEFRTTRTRWRMSIARRVYAIHLIIKMWKRTTSSVEFKLCHTIHIARFTGH